MVSEATGLQPSVTITGYAHNGYGVGRINGQVIFVAGALRGEIVQVQLTGKSRGVQQGKIAAILQPSPHRVPARCTCYDSCGGCQLQHADYQEQVAIKEEIVRNALLRLGGVSELDSLLLPLIQAEQPTGYRNKGIFHVGKTAEGIALRFLQEGSRSLAQAACSELFSVEVQRVITFLEEELNRAACRLEDGKRRGLQTVLLRQSRHTGQILVVFIATAEFLTDLTTFAANLAARQPSLCGIGFCLAQAGDDATNALYRGVRCLWGELFLTDKIGEREYRISPASFFQVNTAQAEQLYDCVRDFAQLTGKERVLDAYCGIGSIGLHLAGQAADLLGVEVVEQAVLDARYNAARNGVSNAEFICAKAEDVISELFERNAIPDLVIVDPPRKGCEPKLLTSIANHGIKRLIYVSCNVATLARDIKILAAHGYKPQKIRPADLFPLSFHVETVVLMSKVR